MGKTNPETVDQPHQNLPQGRLGVPGTPAHLPYHDGESKDTREVVQQLEDDLKQCLGVRQAPNGDEGFDCPVVAADVAERKRGGSFEGVSGMKACFSPHY